MLLGTTLISYLSVVLASFVVADVSNGENAASFSTTYWDNSPETWPARTSKSYRSVWRPAQYCGTANATGGTAWKDAFVRARALVAQMTLEEKVTFITGQYGRCAGNTAAIDRLGIPVLCLQDGPAGVRPIQGSSQFPAGQAVAATWDRELIYQRGMAMGQEFYDQ